MGGMIIYIPNMIVMSSYSVIGLVSFPDQRKRLVWGNLLCQSIVLLQDFCSNAISCYTYVHMYIRGAAQIGDRVDCTKRERIYEAYMHQWVVDNMPVTWCYSIMESDKSFWLHAAHSSRTTLV